jgi:hypothetical protein
MVMLVKTTRLQEIVSILGGKQTCVEVAFIQQRYVWRRLVQTPTIEKRRGQARKLHNIYAACSIADDDRGIDSSSWRRTRCRTGSGLLPIYSQYSWYIYSLYPEV